MNKKLQKWLEEKRESLIQWSKEYDEICKAEGIKGKNMVHITGFDREYVGTMFVIENKSFLAETEVWFNEEENCEEK